MTAPRSQQVARSIEAPHEALRICRILAETGHGAWVVGGCVRDALLGRTAKDWDIATSARPEQVQSLFRRVIPTGVQHGTVTVVMRGAPFEVTTLRGDGTYSDGRHPDSVTFVDRIEDDLARRDFTVNAMAYEPTQHQVIDPFGGVADLEAKLLRAVGQPVRRFREDGLRVVRAARFCATLGFQLEEQTEKAIPQALDVLRKVSHERVRDEWIKAFAVAEPSPAFRVMQRTGILEVTLPELLEQVGCEQNKWHAYDVWEHTLRCLDAMQGDAMEKLGALLHDLGKPRSRQLSDKTQDYTFYHHERIGADLADRWLKAYRFSNHQRRKVVELVRHHLVCYSSEWSDSAVRRFVRRVSPELVDPLLRLARADALAKGRPVDGELAALDELQSRVRAVQEQGNALSTRQLAINGKDVMARLNIAPSRRVGELLEQLLEEVTDDPALNERQRLLQRLDELAEGG